MGCDTINIRYGYDKCLKDIFSSTFINNVKLRLNFILKLYFFKVFRKDI